MADTETSRPESFAANLLQFGRLLRRAGVDVHHNRLIESLRALEWMGVRRRDDVHATLRALLVHRHDDLRVFDAAFELFFAHRDGDLSSLLSSQAARARPLEETAAIAAAGISVDPATDDPSQRERLFGAYSATAVSRTKDFAAFTNAELDEARRVLARLPWQLGRRRTRRWQRAGGAAIDLRPLLRRSLTRGEMFELTRRRRRTAPRPIVVIGDVSGSMERYSRVLLHFVHGLAHGAQHVESFVFATTLTRISRRITETAAAHDLARVIREVKDWGGGTRIGESLRTFNTHWARRVMRHGPVVLLVSDGWDRGDPATIAREIRRLRRSCRRLIWLNPLLGSPGYEPLTQGMQAALPHLDDFLPVHNIASLEKLAAYLSDLPMR
jgi:uncharacterized protein with von Willebrand factor type A (vWA) domain